jgi:uncharacterized protein (TIGR03086 family)
MTTSRETTAGLLEAVLDDLALVVEAVEPGQLHHPTPCTDWNLAQLRDHAVGWLSTFAAGFADPDGQAPRATLDGYEPSADPAAEVRAAAHTLTGAVRAGATTRPLRLGTSAMPGEMALNMILWEYLMHGWDLARATGQDWRPSAQAAEESLSFAPAMLTDGYQGDGKPFGKPVPVPASAPPLNRLLGLSGRDPAWSRD